MLLASHTTHLALVGDFPAASCKPVRLACLCLDASAFATVSVSVSASASRSACVSASLCLSLCLCLSLYLSVSLCLSISLCLSFPLFVSLSLRLACSLSPSPSTPPSLHRNVFLGPPLTPHSSVYLFMLVFRLLNHARAPFCCLFVPYAGGAQASVLLEVLQLPQRRTSRACKKSKIRTQHIRKVGCLSRCPCPQCHRWFGGTYCTCRRLPLRCW